MIQQKAAKTKKAPVDEMLIKILIDRLKFKVGIKEKENEDREEDVSLFGDKDNSVA